jgi:hypothetical protein
MTCNHVRRHFGICGIELVIVVLMFEGITYSGEGVLRSSGDTKDYMQRLGLVYVLVDFHVSQEPSFLY